MTSSATLFDTWNLIAAVIVMAVLLSNLADWLRSRAYTQKVAAEAFRAHLAAVEKIIDDPALPVEVVRFVADFNFVVSNKRSAHEFYKIMMTSEREKVRESGLTDTLNTLSRTRPDLVEGVLMAVSKGLLSMLYRTSPNVKQIDDFIACLATEPRREIQVASKVVKSQSLNHANLVAA
ncbi:hypothetical protein [Shinella sp.]|uniref:hypothetical protein n=1 Tax=Shinella sp. TaxID=1870904 RepID=UPI00301B9D3C